MSDYISEDNLVLIFKYLPVKALLRFRCVCKDWKQLIDSPIFLQQHLSVQKPRFIVDPHRGKYLVVDGSLPRPLVNTLSKPIQRKRFVLVGTLHGVVCLCEYRTLVLWNPSLRKFTSLPLPPGFKLYLGETLQNCYGFWIDPCSKDFKVIILQQRPVMMCILYSSIRHGWSVIPTGKLVKWKPCNEGPPVMIGGVAHWGGCLDETVNALYYHDYYHGHKNKVVLAFDFTQECFDVIARPNLNSRYSVPCRWKGTLSLLCWDINENNGNFGSEIYQRQKDSWVKMVRVEYYKPIVQAFWAMEDIEERKNKGKRKRDMDEWLGDIAEETQENFRVLATLRSGKRLPHDLMLYGTKTGSQTVMKGLGDYAKVNVAYDFVESLLFP